MHAMTAAHKTLPFGTWLLVENLENGKTARVRVNDRGPFAGNRILDVSRAAAVALGALGTGVFRIRARVVPAPTAAPQRQRPRPRLTNFCARLPESTSVV
jgi:rare lipoprotein A